MGTVIGWTSSGFYLGSRLSQIYKNWSRHSAEGLSIAMFGCAITANICYGASILLRSYGWADILSSSPWLLGSLGTVALDVTIALQVRRKCAVAKEPKKDNRLPVRNRAAMSCSVSCHHCKRLLCSALCFMSGRPCIQLPVAAGQLIHGCPKPHHCTRGVRPGPMPTRQPLLMF